jgi:hypothetical protein
MDGWMNEPGQRNGWYRRVVLSSGRGGGALKYTSLACFLVQNCILCVNLISVVRVGYIRSACETISVITTSEPERYLNNYKTTW